MATTDKVLSLLFVWKLRLQFWAEGDKLRAEGNKLRAEGNKLRAEGDKLWAEAVLESYGNITIDWLGVTECLLENGDIYTDKGMKHASQKT